MAAPVPSFRRRPFAKGHPLVLASAGAFLASCALCMYAGCKPKEVRPKEVDAGHVAPVQMLVAPPGYDAGPERDAGAPVDAGRAPLALNTVTADESSCALVFGPTEVAVRGAGVLYPRGAERTDVLVSEDGEPRLVPIFHHAKAKEDVATGTFATVSYPPCRVAGADTYCASGTKLFRRPPAGTPANEPFLISDEMLKGTPFVVAPLGAGSVVAWLERHASSIGSDVVQAWVRFGQGPAIRLSDEGAGATSVDLVAVPAAPGKGPAKVLAVYIDSRSAMTPMHTVWLVDDRGRLKLGADEVTFVGSPGERHTVVTAAAIPDKNGGFVTAGLLPISQDVTHFGLAVVPVVDPPKVDTSALWSDYPNGLDPAPLAVSAPLPADVGRPACCGSASTPYVYLARVRPETKDRNSERVLELTTLDSTFAIRPLGFLDRGHPIVDLSIASEAGKGGNFVSVLYGNREHTYFQRRFCKP